MNSNLQRAKREFLKLKRVDDIYGMAEIEIILNFTRSGSEPKYYPLTTIRVSKQLANTIRNK